MRNLMEVTLCGGSQLHLEESYKLWIHKATVDALLWHFPILLQLPKSEIYKKIAQNKQNKKQDTTEIDENMNNKYII